MYIKVLTHAVRGGNLAVVAALLKAKAWGVKGLGCHPTYPTDKLGLGNQLTSHISEWDKPDE